MTRGPLVEIGSLVTWTIMSWPRFSTSWIGGTLPRRPLPAAIAAIAGVARSARLGVVVLMVVGVGIVVRVVGLHVGGVQEGTLLRPDVDEGCLNAGKNCFYFPEIDVADHAAGVWTVDQELYEPVVLQNRDARFARSRVYEDFTFHCSPRGPGIVVQGPGHCAVQKRKRRGRRIKPAPT